MDDAWHRIIAHADLDAFYASVEQLDHPELRGQPVLVGPSSGRGVVLTASYEARPFRVGSAMPMSEALRRCPDACIVAPRFERYQELSALVMQVFYDYSPHVEAISLDEAFLDMTGTRHIFGPPAEMAARLQADVHTATGGLSISVGVATTKYVAKVASGYAKPQGLTVVPAQQAQRWLAPQPVSRLWGAGPKTSERLRAAGYHCIGDVAAAQPHILERQFGAMGRRFHALAHAIDPREVARRTPADGTQVRSRSMSSDRTLARDIHTRGDVEAHLTRAADRLAVRLRNKGWLAGGVRVKLRTANFRTLTRQRTCPPTDLASQLLPVALALLDEFDTDGPFRLVGLATYELQRPASADTAQLDLFASSPRDAALEHMIDAARERFGDEALQRARDISGNTLIRRSVNLDFMEDLGDDAEQD